jgi:hypothetical protein
MADNNLSKPAEGFIKSRYNELSTIRDKYRDRGREYSKLTIPSLLPEADSGTETTEFQNDYNTEGAKLVNSLANKYMETLFPAGRSYIKFTMPEEMYQSMEQQGQDKASIESTFSMIERAFREKFTSIGARAVLLDMLKQLIGAGGNSVLYLPKDGKAQNYCIDEFVVSRSLDGQLLELITEDQIALLALDPELKSEVVKALDIDLSEDGAENQNVSIFTYVRRDPEDKKRWLVDQAVENVNIGEQNQYNEDNLRWIVCGWNRTRREMYYRPLIEEHYGSFWTLSILTEAMAVGCVTLADIKYLVKPGSLLDVAELNNSATGTYHYGMPDDVSAIETGKSRDVVLIKDVIDTYKRHLGEVFMYAPSTLRSGERVTAEEVRIRATELENAHGGVYSSLAEQLQKPLAKLVLSEMNVTGLNEANVSLDITTGVDALSRGNDNDKIRTWLGDVQALAGLPPEVLQRFNLESYLKVTAAGRDVDFTKIVLTEQEVAAIAQQAAQQQAGLDAQVRQAGKAAQQQQPQIL